MGAHESPFAFYARILGADGGRARFFARLGPEAADALDEFLELALDYERARRRRCRASSPGCAPATREVKRDMEIARDEVRVMTVHGAKGLEAPIVILADTTTPPKGPQRAAPAARCRSRTRRPARRDRLVWAGARPTIVAPVAAARASAVRDAEDEYRRLLYVAMTRAADRLVICGLARREPHPGGLLVRADRATR